MISARPQSIKRRPASAQQISNILWAAGRAPVAGKYRSIYLATPGGTYLYDPAGRSLGWYSNEAVTDGGFAIVYDAELEFDAGVMFMSALLASVSLGRSTEAAVASCPKGIGYPKTRLFFGVQAAYDARADFDHDGLVNVADLRLLAANWLRTVQP